MSVFPQKNGTERPPQLRSNREFALRPQIHRLTNEEGHATSVAFTLSPAGSTNVPPTSSADAFAQLKTCIGPYLLSARQILEAGGGSLSHIDIPASAQVTVIDISPEQLENHKTAHTKILGDLHAVDMGTSVFDVAVIWNVVEHLENPALVLDKLRAALRPGGIIVIAAPHPESLQAIVTKWTPYWFHVFVLKHVFQSRTAGLPGFPPFRTVHHTDIAPQKLEVWAHQNGLELLLYIAYESSRRAVLHKMSPSIGLLWDVAIRIGNAVTRSSLDASDYIFVLKQPA